MKVNHLFILGAIALIGCSGGEQNDEQRLVEAKKELEVLTAEVKDLEAKIAAADTTKKVYPIVTSSEVAMKPFQHFFGVQGLVSSDEVAMVSPEAQGSYKSIRVKVGDRVNKGQVLAVVDTDILQSNLKELKTNLELARTVYERQQKLWDQGIGTEIQLLEAKTRKESLEQSIRTVQTQLSKGTVHAPFAGIVDEVFSKQGELANPAMPLARVVNLNKLYLQVEVPETYLAKVKVNNPVMISIPALDFNQQSKITRVGKFIEANNRTFKAQIDLPNKEQSLVPNLVASVKIQDFALDSALVVPSNNILQNSEGNSFVYKLEDKGDGYVAMKQFIEIGSAYEGETVIRSGLSANDIIVASGARSINDQDRVQVK